MEGATISVPENGLRAVLRFVGEDLHRQEMARTSYREQGGIGRRHTGSMSLQFRLLKEWWAETCQIVGMDPDLREY